MHNSLQIIYYIQSQKKTDNQKSTNVVQHRDQSHRVVDILHGQEVIVFVCLFVLYLFYAIDVNNYNEISFIIFDHYIYIK